MQVLRVIGGLFALMLCTAFAIAFLPNVANMANSARTDPSEATGLSCTAAANGICNIVLPAPHMHPDASNMTILVTTGTQPPVKDSYIPNDDIAVATDRVTISIKDLTPTASFIFTVDYEIAAANIADATGLGDMLRLFPLFFVLMLLIVGVMVAGMAIGKQLQGA